MRDCIQLHFAAVQLLVVLLGTAVVTFAQEEKETSHCRPDEFDMGDYCASLPPPGTNDEAAVRRVTPFRGRSMMPGRTKTPTVRRQAGRAAPRRAGPVTPQAEPTSPIPAHQANSGFVVQLGVFSEKPSALAYAETLRKDGLAISVARVTRGNRVLWACIHGPFPDGESAATAAGRLRIDHHISDTYIKPLDDLELTELSHDTTEK